MKLQNASDNLRQEEIWEIIESQEAAVAYTFHRAFSNGVIFLMLLLCFQGG